MAYQSRIRFTIQDASDNYYTATKNSDNTWTVSTTPTLTYLTINPLGWENTGVTWERNMTYFGVFRSQSQTMQFTADGRAIINSIMFGSGGVNAFAVLKVWLLDAETFSYDLFYKSEIDFSPYNDNKQKQIVSVATLDGKLYELLKSKASSKFNIPFWDYDPDTDTWDYISAGSDFLAHGGIKLFWGGRWVSAATPTTPLIPNTAGATLYPWNRGSVSDGRHWIPVMTQVNMPKNNGTTTYVGNDILEPFLPQSNQPYNYNRNFEGTDDIQAYTLNRCMFKHLLNNAGSVGLPFDVNITVRGTFLGNITYSNVILQDQHIKVVLFEIGEDDLPVMSGGNYQYTTLGGIIVPAGGSPYTPPSSGVFENTITTAINYNKAYCVGIIYDGETSGISGVTCVVAFSELHVTIETAYNSGTSAPVDGAILPESIIVGQRLFNVFSNILDVIDSTETDPYGFPVLQGTGYSAISTFLTNAGLSLEDYYDSIPYLTMLTSENAIRNIKGYPYMNISLSDLFNICFKMYACGLGITSDLGMRIEPLEYWFDKDTEILDLGTTVSGFTIKPFTELMGNRINGGFGQSDTNKNFATDAFNIEQRYEVPLNKTPKDIDLQVTECNAEMYYIEKARAQNNSRDSSPSSSNDLVIFEITNNLVEDVTVYDPSGDALTVDALSLAYYPTAQSTNPATTPYIYGLKYPETAINTGLTPASNKLRLGRFIRTICDGMEGASDFVTYRKQYQQQYNNPSTPATELPGIEKNLNGVRITEVGDVLISSLGDKYFRPYIFSIESKYPVNMYTLINTNPRGYISFTWDGVEYKGFIYKVTQVAGNSMPTQFELIAHPDTTDAQLKA
jgi:hypothetical protein